MFHDTGRYAELMAATKDERKSQRLSWHSSFSTATMRDSRTPSLVSFVGQSGAGKSTLINLMIAFRNASNTKLSSPVVGATGKDVPTSEDVHLYPDPSTSFMDHPILFADCEGLDGGEREPVKSVVRKTKDETEEQKPAGPDAAPKAQYYSERALLWADTPERRTRQFAVAHLYPRLLFTFSDTIVFVLKNPRVIESVFEKLIDWAAAALETASNQPVLPCAIIALNASELNIDAELWDVDICTSRLLESLAGTVHQNAAFQKYAEFWRARNKYVNTLEELVLCYYSSIQVSILTVCVLV
jgi:energy-coupling factor transporter ATP-binding protein EcfA2